MLDSYHKIKYERKQEVTPAHIKAELTLNNKSNPR